MSCLARRSQVQLLTWGVAVLACIGGGRPAEAHPWHRHRGEDEASHTPTTAPADAAPAEPTARQSPFLLAAARKPEPAGLDIGAAFAPFEKRRAIATRHDDRWFYVESNGIPDHPLMVGIRSWQQQVPLPQPYTGANAWQIPLHPVRAAEPVSTKDHFLRGAIAVAVNGIPIFNPLNNRGEDALAIGELDEYGGHCGRADDYHYHIAPVHLEKVVGKGMPIAYALDGYPVYGETEPDGSPVKPLDALGGHEDSQGGYHYHALKRYPYLIGGFRGEVVERDGQVDPQPRAQGVREPLGPLRGATIVGFETPMADTRKVVYEVGGRRGSIEYTVAEGGSARFTFTDPSGRTSTETYARRPRGPGGGGRPGGGGPRGPGGGGGPPRPGEQPPRPPAAGGPSRAEPARIAARQITVTQSAEAAAPRRPPNFIVILVDDMGWRDVGFMGNTFVETPNIDRLAKTGVVFMQSYASAPNCAPTRACLMSGQVTPRHGIYTVVDPRQPAGSPWHKLVAAHSESELATEVVTLPEALKPAGYATAFFGMWNLGRGRTGPRTPGGQGFDTVVFPETLGFGKDAYFDDAGDYLTDRLTDAVVSFIDDHRDRPFFVYLADHAVHAPHDPKPDLLAKYTKKAAAVGNDRRDDPAYAATIEAVDQGVGRIMKTLRDRGLADETYVIFTSDNGGTPQYTPPLKGSKGQLYEGGIRVPLVVAGPTVAKPGTTSDLPVASIDLYPTLLELSGAAAPAGQPLDGVSWAGVLAGEPPPARARMFWHFPCYVGKATPSSALRAGDLKLIEFFEGGGRVELYDLRADPHEQHDLSATMPAETKALTAALREWQRETKAAIPSGPNPAYDPQAERPRGGRGGKPGGRGR